MQFFDKTKPHGHLQISKRFPDGSEELVFDDHNVITSGLGQSIAQFMSVDCSEDPCTPTTRVLLNPNPKHAGHGSAGSNNNQRMSNALSESGEGTFLKNRTRSTEPAAPPLSKLSPCNVRNYLMKSWQVGTGASGVTESISTTQLGGALTDEQYGGPGRSVALQKEVLTIWENEFIQGADNQVMCKVENTNTAGSGIIHIMVLDENTANGTVLNEIGLFTWNPFTKFEIIQTKSDAVLPTPMGDPRGERPSAPINIERPGHLLGAYRQFSDIAKEDYFSLIFRWTINFTENC